MPTALGLIETSATKLGLRRDEVTSQDATDALEVLNSMLDALAVSRQYVYQIKQASHTWPAATSSRTIGSAGNFNTARPYRIEEGTFFRDSSNNDVTVQVTTDRRVYDAIPLKTATGTFPSLLFYDTAYPLGVIYVWPVPTAALTLLLNSWQILQSFSALTTDLALPPGYQYFIENNLAVELESVFRVPCPESVKINAARSRSWLTSLNKVSFESTVDIGSILGQQPATLDINSNQ